MKIDTGSAFFFLAHAKQIASNVGCIAALVFAMAPAGAAQEPVAAVQTPANTVVSADNQSASTTQNPKQKQLADDTAKLLQLANELKAELDKSSKDTLSLSVMKKAEQVEKLAHKVREEMKASLTN
jgi:hypothetical protein